MITRCRTVWTGWRSPRQRLRLVYNPGDGGAVAAARTADFVVVVRGGVQAKEGEDRTSLRLDDTGMDSVTDAVTAAVAAAKLALVVVTGEPVALEGLRARFGAILLALEGGQAAGTAVAEVLFGAVSPSGVLPFTMYAESYVRETDMADMSLRPNSTSGSKGKTYRFYSGQPVWPFGHGLSYATFELGWAAVPPRSLPAAALRAGVRFEVWLTNRGSVEASKVVQLYLSTPDLPDAPLRSLAAVTKVRVPAGGNATVTLDTAAVAGTCAFCVVDTTGGARIPPGTRYRLDVGDGAGAFFPAFELVSQAA